MRLPNRFRQVTCSVLTLAFLGACAQPGEPGHVKKSDVGTLGGAALGAVLGSNVGKGKGNVAAIAVGTLLGAGLGREIGASLDRADMVYHQRAANRALETQPSGQPLPWNNPNSSASGTITPTNYYQNASGQYCREYQQTISVGGKTANGYGVACRQPDGSWQIQN